MTGEPRSRRLADHLATLRLADLPQAASSLLKLCILDHFGCAIGSLGSAPAAVVAALVERSGSGGGACSLVGRPERTTPETAAFANGTLSHVLVFDDLHRHAKLHPGVSVIPAAWALAELAGADGPSFLAAVAAGYEATARIGIAVNMSAHRLKGWRATGTCNSFGAAVAAARVLGLDGEATHQALAAAGAQASGNWAFQQNGGMELYLAAGTAARNGVVAGLLAASGFVGAADPLEATDGGFFATTSEAAHPGRLTQGLGTKFCLQDTCIKMYPTCHSTQTGIDAAVNLRERHRVAIEDVERITVRAGDITRLQCGWTFEPAPPARLIFHMGYAIAVALRRGAVRPADFSGERLSDPHIVRLAAATEVVADPELTAIYAERKPCEVTLHMRDGRVLRERVDFCRGEPENPPTPEIVVEKFRDLTAGRMGDADGARLIELVLDLDRLSDLGAIGDCVRRAGRRSPPMSSTLGGRGS